MNTRILLDHEPVADGGFYVRAVLIIEGSLPAARGREPGRVSRSVEAAHRLSATNVRVRVRPGADADFIQMRHTFDSQGDGDILTVDVGNVHCLDQIRIRMEALVGARADHRDADVATLIVRSEASEEGETSLETVVLPVRLSVDRGGWVRPIVSRAPLVTLPE